MRGEADEADGEADGVTRGRGRISNMRMRNRNDAKSYWPFKFIILILECNLKAFCL